MLTYCVTKSGRVWRKVPESGARNVLSVHSFWRCCTAPVYNRMHRHDRVCTLKNPKHWQPCRSPDAEKCCIILVGMGSAALVAAVTELHSARLKRPEFLPQGIVTSLSLSHSLSLTHTHTHTRTHAHTHAHTHARTQTPIF